MSATLVFEFTQIPSNITEDSMKVAVETTGEETWSSHEMVLPEKVRPEIAIKVRLGKVSFFILNKWETYAIGKDIPTCLRRAYELLGKIRDATENPEITLQEISIEYSKTRGILSYALPYLTWIIGLYLGKIGDLNVWIVITIIYIIVAIIIEGKEQIYSSLLLKYYADP